MSVLPKPYPLSELSRRIERALADCLALARYELVFDIEAAVVTLRGCVASYYHKQLAQESLRQVAGLRAIRNEIEVRQPTPQSAMPFARA